MTDRIRLSPQETAVAERDRSAGGSAREQNMSQALDDLRHASGQKHRREEQTLENAGRILEHLRSQLAEIDRREQGMNQQLSALDQEKRSLRLWAQQFNDQAEKWEQDLRERDVRISEKEKVSDEHATDLEVRETQLAHERERFAAERAALKADLVAEIQQERDDLALRRREVDSLRGTLDQRDAEVRQREADLEKRVRFHEDHLNRLRQELTTKKREVELQRQSQRLWIEQVEESIRLRIAQMRRFRDLLERREQTVDQERELLLQSRLAFEAEQSQVRNGFEQERRALDTERTQQTTDYQRQQDLLAKHAESLDIRQQRIDRLRDELEQQHRVSLEAKVVQEQAMQSWFKTAGDENARQVLAEAKESLSQHYGHTRESLAQLRAEIDEGQRQFAQKRDGFRTERDSFAEWAGRRETEMQTRQGELQKLYDALNHKEATWNDTRQRWRNEQIEASEVIRGLVKQLEAALAVPYGPLPSMPRNPGEATRPRAA